MMFHDPIHNSCTFLYCIRNSLVNTYLTHCSSMITEKTRVFLYFCTLCIFSLIATDFHPVSYEYIFGDSKILFEITSSYTL